MALYRDEAIVLRAQRLGEADRIVTLLTRRDGRVRAVAKGVRKTMSKFGSRLEPGTRVDLMLFTSPGRALDIVTQADTLDAHGAGLVDDYGAWTSAVAMLETAERLTPIEREPALRLYLLLSGALRVMAGREHPAGLVLDAFALRALGLSGYAPSLAHCAVCGSPGPHRWFSPSAGGSVSVACRPAAAGTVRPEALELACALLAGDWAKADASLPRDRREAGGLVAAFLSWHLERGLRSLPLVERG